MILLVFGRLGGILVDHLRKLGEKLPKIAKTYKENAGNYTKVSGKCKKMHDFAFFDF